MKYTQSNVELALQKIDPESFNIWKNKAKLALPDIIDKMFIKGFALALKSSFAIGTKPFSFCGLAIVFSLHN